MGKNELQIIKIAHLQNKREMQRFYFLGCQLGALPHALACRGFWGTSAILSQRPSGQRAGQAPTGSPLGVARRDLGSCSKPRISESSEATARLGWSEVLLLWDILCRVGLESEPRRKGVGKAWPSVRQVGVGRRPGEVRGGSRPGAGRDARRPAGGEREGRVEGKGAACQFSL